MNGRVCRQDKNMTFKAELSDISQEDVLISQRILGGRTNGLLERDPECL